MSRTFSPLLSYCHYLNLTFHPFLGELLPHYPHCPLLAPKPILYTVVTEITFLKDQSNYIPFMTKFCQRLPLTFKIQSLLLNVAYKSPAYWASVSLSWLPWAPQMTARASVTPGLLPLSLFECSPPLMESSG